MSTILEEAAKVTTTERQKAYGHPKENFDTIAILWDVYLDQRRISWQREHPSEKASQFAIGPADVAAMMILTKVARLANTPNHRDSLIDIAGYARTWEMLGE